MGKLRQDREEWAGHGECEPRPGGGDIDVAEPTSMARGTGQRSQASSIFMPGWVWAAGPCSIMPATG
jgi:hypothetical protein